MRRLAQEHLSVGEHADEPLHLDVVVAVLLLDEEGVQVLLLRLLHFLRLNDLNRRDFLQDDRVEGIYGHRKSLVDLLQLEKTRVSALVIRQAAHPHLDGRKHT